LKLHLFFLGDYYQERKRIEGGITHTKKKKKKNKPRESSIHLLDTSTLKLNHFSYLRMQHSHLHTMNTIVVKTNLSSLHCTPLIRVPQVHHYHT